MNVVILLQSFPEVNSVGLIESGSCIAPLGAVYSPQCKLVIRICVIAKLKLNPRIVHYTLYIVPT